MKTPSGKNSTKLSLAIMAAVLVLATLGKGLTSIAEAARPGTVVIFNANWCASCREVNPIVHEVASQNNLGVTEIDVDAQTAPKQAQTLGLSMPNDEPPQVYYVNHGKATLLYNGRGFKFGYGDSVRAALLQNLQRVLP